MPEIDQLLINNIYFTNINGKQYTVKIADNIYQPKIGTIVDYAVADSAEVDQSVCYYEEYESSYEDWEPIIPVGPPPKEEPEEPEPEEPEVNPDEIEPSQVYLYNAGDVPDITGGWTPMGEQDLDAGSADTGTELQIYGIVTGNSAVPSGSYTALCSNNKIDFTNYNTLHIHFLGLQKAGAGADNTGWGLLESQGTNGSLSFTSSGGTDFTESFDISATTNAYLNFFTINHSNDSRKAPQIRIDRIWMTK